VAANTLNDSRGLLISGVPPPGELGEGLTTTNRKKINILEAIQKCVLRGLVLSYKESN
jgi:hypothetical protein